MSMKSTAATNGKNPLRELLVDELKDLLHAEGQLVKALPKMAKASHHPTLKKAFTDHLGQTEHQVERLKQIFDLLEEKAQPKPCKAMMGLVEEGKETIEEGAKKEDYASDLALVAAAQKVEHYEMSGYSSVRNLAEQIGEKGIVALLEATLEEEQTADAHLRDISRILMQQAKPEAVALANKQTA